jgi:hypothetical protein
MILSLRCLVFFIFDSCKLQEVADRTEIYPLCINPWSKHPAKTNDYIPIISKLYENLLVNNFTPVPFDYYLLGVPTVQKSQKQTKTTVMTEKITT